MSRLLELFNVVSASIVIMGLLALGAALAFRRRRGGSESRWLGRLLVGATLVCVAAITLWPSGGFHFHTGRPYVNLVPGEGTMELFASGSASAGGAAAKVAWANVLMCLPLGLFLPYAFRDGGVRKALVFVVLFPPLLETAQYVTGLGRSTDIDTALLNIAGALAGVAATALMAAAARRGRAAPVRS